MFSGEGKRMRNPALLATTVFGVGRLPWCPGTWASLLPAAAAAAALFLAFPIDAVRIALGICGTAFSAATIWGGAKAQKVLGAEDPRAVVSDEVAGQCVALLPAADPLGALVAFAAFRFFDVAKPWPIKRLERLPAGYGILADDLAAGLIAAACVIGARLLGLAGC
jgi:phosphatidylglycerophosphatase A